LPIIIALRFTGEGEVFYRQIRIGHKNKKFQILKFASMLKNSPDMKGGSITVRNDPRVTPVGRILRMTKLNELPQIFNVLIGDMSFVGPRPLMEEGFLQYTAQMQAVVNNERPGITGIGSVVFRDEEKLITETKMPRLEYYSKCILPQKGALEVWYQENISFLTDIKILILTLLVVLFPAKNLVSIFFNNLPDSKEI
jgi:lipopolysaccharide/colanic/teichoic acid biosynthesis glycosyltransferase